MTWKIPPFHSSKCLNVIDPLKYLFSVCFWKTGVRRLQSCANCLRMGSTIFTKFTLVTNWQADMTRNDAVYYLCAQKLIRSQLIQSIKTCHTIVHGTHLHFNGHFPDDPGSAGSSSVLTCRMPFLSPNQQCQSSEGNTKP